MKIVKMVKEEYVNWIFSPKMILLGCMFIILYTLGLSELVQYAEKRNQPINALEPFIGLLNSMQFLGFIPIVFLVLIADFPRTDNNIIYRIYRIGRKKWVISEMFFLLLADVSFLFVLFLGITGSCFSEAFIYNGWSEVVTELNQKSPELQGTFLQRMIPPNIYYQMLPYKATVLTFVFLFLYLYLLGMILMVFKLLGKQKAGIIGSAGILLLGSAIVGTDSLVKWGFPAAHSSLTTHFSAYYSKMNCSIGLSMGYFLFFIGILVLISLLLSERYDYMKITHL